MAAADGKGGGMRWLVTGAQGFIGGHLVDALASRAASVRVLDDISSPAECLRACDGVDVVLHMAALSSVSLCEDSPGDAICSNIIGFQNMIEAAMRAGAGKFIYATTALVDSSVYSATKRSNELYAGILSKAGFGAVGLRYSNVYGPRQSAVRGHVIPTWLTALANGQKVKIYGTGETIRDYIYIDDVVHETLAAVDRRPGIHEVGTGVGTTLKSLFWQIKKQIPSAECEFADARGNESPACVASKSCGKVSLKDGLAKTIAWYAPMREAA